jgi:hypothetical protein
MRVALGEPGAHVFLAQVGDVHGEHSIRMKAQISSLPGAAENALHERGTRAPLRCGCRAADVHAASGEKSARFPLGTIDMLLWIRHLSPTATPWREKSGSLEFRSVQRRNTDGEEESEEGRQEA